MPTILFKIIEESMSNHINWYVIPKPGWLCFSFVLTGIFWGNSVLLL